MGVLKNWCVMVYEYQGDVSLDYFSCYYGKSCNVFRGPACDLSKPYGVVLGGNETYGKFVPKPFPQLVQERVNIQIANLGVMHGGADLYLKDPDILSIARKSQAIAIQIMGGINISNRLYSVHPRRNDRFVGASDVLKALYREVDFTEFHFTKHMLYALNAASSEKFDLVRQELRQAWIARMKNLLELVDGRAVLFWIGQAPPEKEASSLEAALPLVDAGMIDEICPYALDYVESQPSADAKKYKTAGMVFSEFEEHIANKMPNAMMHGEFAQMLSQKLENHLIR